MIVTAAVAVILSSVLLHAPVPQQAASAEQPTAALQGRVVAADGQPIPRVALRLLPFGRNAVLPQATVTDMDGKYRFDRVQPGRYRLLAEKDGFVPMYYGQHVTSDPGDPFLLRPGDAFEHVDITLPRHSAITGRIVDENGDPVDGASVHAQQLRYVEGRYRLEDASAAHPRLTDDRGHYRLYGLRPGTYVISARVGQIDFPRAGMVNLPGYAPTFFPGTTRAADAQGVKVGLAEDVSGIDFAITRVPTATVSGRAMLSNGDPITGGLTMRPNVRSGGTAEPSGAVINQDGTFEFHNVAPGEYVIIANKGRQHPTREGEFGARFVKVDGDDVSGIILRTSSGSTMSGHVVLEGGGASPGDFTIVPYPVDPDLAPPPGGSIAQAELKADLTFSISGLNGPRRIRLTEAPPGWMLKGVRVTGVDVTDDVLNFGTAEESLSDVEIVLTRNAAMVTGTVTMPDAAAGTEASVLVFSADPDRWDSESRFMRAGGVQPDGRFVVAGLPSGDYFIVAIPRPEGDSWKDPAFLQSLAVSATRRLVTEGQPLSLTLKLMTPPRVP